MVKWLPLGLEEALKLTLERICPLEAERVELADCVDRVVAEDLDARVDSPSVDASLKDGYAVIAADVAVASPEHPVRLQLSGTVSAGSRQTIRVASGATVRVLTGARIPPGADAVVAEEFTKSDGSVVSVENFAEPGRNILPKGSDIALGKRVACQGDRLCPGQVGMLAAAGHSQVSVVRSPEVAIVATGDEVVAPGRPLPEGKLYASNMVTLGAWCRRYRMPTRMAMVRDRAEELLDTIQTLAGQVDAIITSGGAWTGDRDMVAKVLEQLGWTQVFHRIRIGPGKAVGFGLLNQKPVFILPGGPPSNLMGFLQIALPGLLRLGGHRCPGLPLARVRLGADVKGRYVDWTQLIFGMLEQHGDLPVFHSLKGESRLRSMAEAQAVVSIPEGLTRIAAETVVSVQLLQ
jgi:molybdopterin molybdotransferase